MRSVAAHFFVGSFFALLTGLVWGLCHVGTPALAAAFTTSGSGGSGGFEEEQSFNESLGITARPALLHIFYVAGTHGELYPCPT